jgi:hypothetical protein
MRVPVEEFRALELEVHAFLADVTLRDVSAVDLPDGGAGRDMSDVHALRSRDGALTAALPVRLLFSLRLLLGRMLGWDRALDAYADESYIGRLTDDQRARSLEEPGSADGPFQLLYRFPLEVLGETRNATVHAFSCMTLCRIPDGYRLYWAIYVKNVSRFTPLYMVLIEPFRRFVVYPAILRRLRSSWMAAYPSRDGEERVAER